MINTTLCYLEQDDRYLMLLRNKKQNDLNEGKWIGLGGKFEKGETPQECLLREVKEEAGVELTEYRFRGVIGFYSDIWEEEQMYLFTASKWDGEIDYNCSEGELRWIKKNKLMELNLWEGDRIFLKRLLEEEDNIRIDLKYQGDDLIQVITKS